MRPGCMDPQTSSGSQYISPSRTTPQFPCHGAARRMLGIRAQLPTHQIDSTCWTKAHPHRLGRLCTEMHQSVIAEAEELLFQGWNAGDERIGALHYLVEEQGRGRKGGYQEETEGERESGREESYSSQTACKAFEGCERRVCRIYYHRFISLACNAEPPHILSRTLSCTGVDGDGLLILQFYARLVALCAIVYMSDLISFQLVVLPRCWGLLRLPTLCGTAIGHVRPLLLF